MSWLNFIQRFRLMYLIYPVKVAIMHLEEKLCFQGPLSLCQ